MCLEEDLTQYTDNLVKFLVGEDEVLYVAYREPLIASSWVMANNFEEGGIWHDKTNIEITATTFDAFNIFVQLCTVADTSIKYDEIVAVYALTVKYRHVKAMECIENYLQEHFNELTESDFIRILPWVLKADLHDLAQAFIEKKPNEILETMELLQTDRIEFSYVLEHLSPWSLESVDSLVDVCYMWALEHCVEDSCDQESQSDLRLIVGDILDTMIPFYMLSTEKLDAISRKYTDLFSEQSIAKIRAASLVAGPTIKFELCNPIEAFKEITSYTYGIMFTENVIIRDIVTVAFFTDSGVCQEHTITIWKVKRHSENVKLCEMTTKLDDKSGASHFRLGVELVGNDLYIIEIQPSDKSATRLPYQNVMKSCPGMVVFDPHTIIPASMDTAIESITIVYPPTTNIV